MKFKMQQRNHEKNLLFKSKNSVMNNDNLFGEEKISRFDMSQFFRNLIKFLSR